jgi:hypothetical protein
VVLRAKRNEAILMRRNGHHGVALKLARENHQAYLTVFGPAHEQTYAANLTLCNSLRVCNELDEAYERGEETYRAYQTSFSAGHPMTLVTMVDLAIVLRLRRDLDAAEQLNGAALDGLRNVGLHPDHPWILCALNNQANILAAKEQHEDARKISEEATDRSRRKRGEDHPHTLACAANFAQDLYATGKGMESTSLRRDTLARLRAKLGNDHPDTIAAGLEIRMDCDIEPPPM